MTPTMKTRRKKMMNEKKKGAPASGEDCIINAGYGYYRPGEDDDFEAEIYFASERSRAKEILRKVRRMEEVYNRRYQ